MPGRAWVTLGVVAAWTVVGLWVEGRSDVVEQMALGVLTAGVLAGLLAVHPPRVRATTILVVCIATCGEVVASVVWGLYDYRLDNLPSFVPPGHGLVYLGGLALADITRTRGDWLVGSATAAVIGWGLAGVTVLPVTDVSGALGCTVLALTLIATRSPVYAGVFVVVGLLELYGTALGTWSWDAVVPGLGIPQGNPPSGAASGYVLFEVAAIAVLATLRPRLLVARPRHGRSA